MADHFCWVCCRLCVSLQPYVVTKSNSPFGSGGGASPPTALHDRLSRQCGSLPPLLGRHHPLEVVLRLFLGLLLCAYFIVLAWRGYPRRSPTVSYCVLFLLLTAVGVAGIRSDLGISQSLDSRYVIYSALLLIFAWFSIVEEILQHQDLPLRRNRIFLAAVFGAVLFCLIMDFWGWFYLEQRNHRNVLGMATYELSVSTGSNVGPILPFPCQGARSDELERRAPIILGQSIKLGIYRPPVF
jgi:hypothetical protein